MKAYSSEKIWAELGVGERTVSFIIHVIISL